MSMCPTGYELIFEGLAKVCIPSPELYKRSNGIYEPSWAPTFYNPEMVENRDITMAVLLSILRGYKKSFVFVDPMAATGVRSIRFALEIGKEIDVPLSIYIGDISAKSIDIIKHNVSINRIYDIHNISISINLIDANEYIYYLKRNGVVMDYIDLDPFGTPAPYVHSAMACIKREGVVGVTATDVAVLEGKYANTLYRRYGVKGVKTHISKEIAVRTLLLFLLRVVATFDRFIQPVLSYQYKHYVRTFVSVSEGAFKTDAVLAKCVGRLWHCMSCGYSMFESLSNGSNFVKRCPICGSNMVVVEPLWICNLVNKDFVKLVYANALNMPWLKESTINILSKLSETSYDLPTIRISVLARKLKTSIPQVSRVLKCLEEYGVVAYRSIFYEDGILANASEDLLIKCIKSQNE